jgi:dimethylamine corrinoid protein
VQEKKQLLADIAAAVVDMDEEAAARYCHEGLASGQDAQEMISHGLLRGMSVVSQKYDSGEYFVPELLLCSDALYAGLELLRPHIVKNPSSRAGRVVLGVVQGDTHDIGKNVVKIMLEGAGLEVLDLGRSVQLGSFVEAAVDFRADVIGLSTLMSTTMEGMGEVIDDLVERGLRDRFRVVVGGAPISPGFAKKIGADGYAPSASRAVPLFKMLIRAVDRLG